MVDADGVAEGCDVGAVDADGEEEIEGVCEGAKDPVGMADTDGDDDTEGIIDGECEIASPPTFENPAMKTLGPSAIDVKKVQVTSNVRRDHTPQPQISIHHSPAQPCPSADLGIPIAYISTPARTICISASATLSNAP